MRLVVDDERQRDRLRQMLAEHELEAWPEATLWSSEGLGVLVGECSAGFQIPALGLIVLSYVIFILGLGLTIPVWPDW